MNSAAPVSVTQRSWFWLGLLGCAGLAAWGAWRLFPVALSLLSLDISLDRAGAIQAAQQLAREYRWGPDRATRAVASFGSESDVQAFVELAGGGKAAFAALLSDGLYSPYRWNVRLLREGETHETAVQFRPDGRPEGFAERLRENAPGAALAVTAARELAERAARGAPWRVALEKFTHVESSQITRPGGRIDHTFVYERADRPLGEGRLRLRLVVSGDRFTQLTHFVRVPEAFTRRYAQMRSVNNAVAGAASGVMGVLYLVVGGGVGVWVLLRRRALLWRPALVCAGIFAGLHLLAGLNAWPLVWMSYDTALTAAGFVAQRQVALVTETLGMGVLWFLSFVAAEGLTRLAFPGQPQLWRFWSAPVAASAPALGRTLAGYLAAPIKLLYVVVFYSAASRWLGWWTPTETLVDPNSLAHVWPWFTPFVRALQAGFWEEMLFRAIPLAGAALLGDRFGGRRRWIGAALVLQAVIFAAAHANYPGQPAYSRVVELLLPSLIYGAIFLRWGLVPAILLHFAYDVVLMALPLFVSTAPGVWINRAALVTVALLPLGIAGWYRIRRSATQDWPAGVTNGEWQAPAPAPAEPSRTPWGRAAALPRAAWWGTLLLGLVGIAGWLASANFQRLGPPLTLERGAAERAARAAWTERGVVLPPHFQALVTVSSRPSLVDRYVWTKGGRETYQSLLGTYVPAPRWVVRFVSFTGDVAERAEEWGCQVGGDGRVGRMWHVVPEDRAGATLTRDEARAKVHAVLRERFGLDPAVGREVSAQVRKRPKRTDWTFVYQDTAITALAPGEARIAVVLNGAELADAYRFSHVPEDWEREERQLGSLLRIGGTISSTLTVLGVLVAVGAAVVALSRRRWERRIALTVGAIVLATAALSTVNRWPATSAEFSTTRNLDLQRATAAVAPVIFALLMAGAVGLIAGHAPRGLRPPLPDRRRALIFGGAVGAILVGGMAGLSHLRGHGSPPWANYAGAGNLVPWLAALPSEIAAYLLSTAMLLAIGVLIDRWSVGGTRQRVIFAAAILAGGAVVALDSGAAQLSSWLVAAGLFGVLVAGVYVLALRHDLTVLPITMAVVAIARALESGFQRQHPAALPAGLLAALAVGAIAWWWFRALRTLAARENDPSPDASGTAPGQTALSPASVETALAGGVAISDRAAPRERPASRTATEFAIATQDLTRVFGSRRAVDNLNLTVQSGRFYGFLGPNGAGKSTTIKMLTGLLAPTSGTIHILGEDVRDPPRALAVKRRIGVVPENLALFDHLTGREYLTFIGRMYGLDADTVRVRGRELLAMMELDRDEEKLTIDYSHGMRKKLALAAALIPDPELLFLDEPFEGVDAVASRVLRDTLHRCVERGATVFLTSHVLEIVERLCTDVGIVAGGRLVHQGTMEELRRDGSLEERFIAVVGHERREAARLSWLER